MSQDMIIKTIYLLDYSSLVGNSYFLFESAFKEQVIDGGKVWHINGTFKITKKSIVKVQWDMDMCLERFLE